MAARWLCIGSPQRDLLAKQFCEQTSEERQSGITLRRIDRQALGESLQELDFYAYDEAKKSSCINLKREIAAGNVPDEFLLKQETIPFSALETMETHLKRCFELPNNFDQLTFAEHGRSPDNCFRAGGSFNSADSPIKYFCLNDRIFQRFPGAHNLQDLSSCRESKNFFGGLCEYLSTHSYSYEFFDSPNLNSGVGFAEARQYLYIFSNGSLSHEVWVKDCKPSGIYTPPGCDTPLHSSEISIKSSLGIRRFNLVIPIKTGDEYMNIDGSLQTWGNKSDFLMSTCYQIPKDALDPGYLALTDERLGLIPAKDFGNQEIFAKKNSGEIELCRDSSIKKLRAQIDSLGSSNIFLITPPYDDPVTALASNAILTRDGSVYFFPAGEVFSPLGAWISDPNIGSNNSIMFCRDGKPVKLCSYDEVTKICREEQAE